MSNVERLIHIVKYNVVDCWNLAQKNRVKDFTMTCM